MAHEVGARHSPPLVARERVRLVPVRAYSRTVQGLSKADLTEAQKLLSRDLPVVRVSPKAPWRGRGPGPTVASHPRRSASVWGRMRARLPQGRRRRRTGLWRVTEPLTAPHTQKGGHNGTQRHASQRVHAQGLKLCTHSRSLTRSHSHSLSLALTRSHSLSLAPTRSLALTRSHSLSLALTRSHSLSLALTRSHSLSLALTRSHSLSLALSLSRSRSLTFSLSHSLTHVHLCRTRSTRTQQCTLTLHVCVRSVAVLSALRFLQVARCLRPPVPRRSVRYVRTSTTSTWRLYCLSTWSL